MTGQDFMWNLTAGFMQMFPMEETQHSAEMKNAEFIILEIWILTG